MKGHAIHDAAEYVPKPLSTTGRNAIPSLALKTIW